MPMYTVGVIRDFVAQHFLIGGDWGKENKHHSHHYKLEAIFEGERLDRHGYLLDIAEVKKHLEEVVTRFEDHTLNELPEFAGLNPGLEPFARILTESIAGRLDTSGLHAFTVKLWENAEAFATYRITFR
jgi:6-pyruvoyltetrahydropterin/6-carboxytetrahydropterin synthase